MKNKSYIVLIISALLTIGCTTKDTDSLPMEPYNGDWALQIINSEFSIADLLTEVDDNAYLDINGDTIRLVYADSIEETLEQKYYKLKNINQDALRTDSYINANSFNKISSILGATTTLDTSFTIPLPTDSGGIDIQNAELREIKLTSGTLTIITNPNLDASSLEIEIPSLKTPDGQPFRASSLPVSQNISGYTIDLEHKGNYNTINIVIEDGSIEVKNDIAANTSLINFQITNIAFEHIIGRLGQFKIPVLKGEAAIGFFEEFEQDSQFNLETFGVKMKTKGNWGLPLQLTIDKLLFENTSSNQKSAVDLSSKIFLNRLDNIEQAANNEFANVSSSYNSQETPSLKTALRTLPDNFSYEVSIEGNPNNDTDHNMFISNSSTIKSNFEASIQLHGWLRRYTRRDTLDFDPIELEEESSIDKGSIRFILDNRIPIGLGVDLIFLDNNNNELEGFRDQVVIKAPSVDPLGYSSGENSVQRDIELNKKQLKNIVDNARKVELVYHIETSGGERATPPNVHIRPSDKMKAIIGIRAQVTYDLND